MVVACGFGSAPLNIQAPTLSPERLGVSASKSCSAPAMLSRPAPCSNIFAFWIGCAVYIRIALARLGDGTPASKSSAAAALAMGVAIEVPLIYMRPVGSFAVPLTLSEGFLLTMLLLLLYEAVEQAPISLLPGATRSGLMRLS